MEGGYHAVKIYTLIYYTKGKWSLLWTNFTEQTLNNKQHRWSMYMYGIVLVTFDKLCGCTALTMSQSIPLFIISKYLSIPLLFFFKLFVINCYEMDVFVCSLFIRDPRVGVTSLYYVQRYKCNFVELVNMVHVKFITVMHIFYWIS